MSQKDEFKKNGSGLFKDSREGSVDIDAFKTFSEKYGVEVAKGYTLALADLLPRIENIWMSPGESGKRNEAFALYKYVEGLLQLNLDLNESNCNANMPSPLPT